MSEATTPLGAVEPDTARGPKATRPVFAAGVVVWTEAAADDGKPRILLVHRERHGDWSLPKGKLDPGETLPETAARELREETGIDIPLGAPLARIDYALPSGRPKEVHYWMGELTPAGFSAFRFTPNEEVDRVEWVTTAEARERLTYERDRELMDLVEARFASGQARTRAVICLRHAKAVPPLQWDGDDASRPLTTRGEEQAASVIPLVQAYRPTRVITSPAVRCQMTVAPVSAEAGCTPEIDPRISQEAYDAGDSVLDAVRDATRSDGAVLLCCHSPVIPEIASAVAELANIPARQLTRFAILSTAECVVMHIADAGAGLQVVAVETRGPAQ